MLFPCLTFGFVGFLFTVHDLSAAIGASSLTVALIINQRTTSFE
jgi:hypothetical protein